MWEEKQQVWPGMVKVEYPCCKLNKGYLYNYDLAKKYSEELNKDVEIFGKCVKSAARSNLQPIKQITYFDINFLLFLH